MPEKRFKTAFIIPFYNVWGLLNITVITLLNTTKDVLIIVIDNGTKKKHRIQKQIEKILINDPRCIHIKIEKNIGFTKAVNMGIIESMKYGVDYIAIGNSDLLFSSNWINKVYSLFEKSDLNISAVSPVTNNASSIQTIPALYLKELFNEIYNYKERKVDPKIIERYARRLEHDLKGSYSIVNNHNVGIFFYCVFFKKAVIEELGLLDEKLVHYNSDCDYMRRFYNAGYKIGIALDSFVMHFGSATYKDLNRDKLLKKDMITYRKKWGDPIEKELKENKKSE